MNPIYFPCLVTGIFQRFELSSFTIASSIISSIFRVLSDLDVMYPYSIHFTETTHGWICGNNGIILHSTDGGMTWTRNLRPSHSDLRAVTISDADNYWMGGGRHQIMYKDNWQVVGWNDMTQTNRKSRLNCFPNPFSCTTKISFRIVTPSMVSINVYSRTGQHIAGLFSGYRFPGEYVIDFMPGLFQQESTSAGCRQGIKQQ